MMQMEISFTTQLICKIKMLCQIESALIKMQTNFMEIQTNLNSKYIYIYISRNEIKLYFLYILLINNVLCFLFLK